MAPHPGAFGVVRTHHIHEGVDLYCAAGTPVSAVEAGVVVAVVPFTGPAAGSPWWLDTQAVLVEGESGVVLYGEISAETEVGATVDAGQRIGQVVRVLRNDKGRPTAMLHLELHVAGTRNSFGWPLSGPCPATLQDPTPKLLEVVT
jgi:murein DD-endopeptidase MepM/ murein hydrolase activator NlpD